MRSARKHSEKALNHELRKRGLMRNQYIERIEQENLILRMLLLEAKRFCPADLRNQIEAYFEKPRKQHDKDDDT